MSKIRLIVKVPRTSQVGHESWVDATYIKTVEVDVSPDVYELLSEDSHNVVIGAERIEPHRNR